MIFKIFGKHKILKHIYDSSCIYPVYNKCCTCYSPHSVDIAFCIMSALPNHINIAKSTYIGLWTMLTQLGQC